MCRSGLQRLDDITHDVADLIVRVGSVDHPRCHPRTRSSARSDSEAIQSPVDCTVRALGPGQRDDDREVGDARKVRSQANFGLGERLGQVEDHGAQVDVGSARLVQQLHLVVPAGGEVTSHLAVYADQVRGESTL